MPGEPLVAFSQKVLGDRCVLPEDEYLEDNLLALIERGYEYTEANMNPTGQGPVERAFDRPERIAHRGQQVPDRVRPEEASRPLRRQAARQRHRGSQTYSRVNRTCSGKDRVFVVDFVNWTRDGLRLP